MCKVYSLSYSVSATTKWAPVPWWDSGLATMRALTSKDVSRVTMVTNLFGVLITLLLGTHEPPSKP